jgi:predicted RNA-binding protein with PIN domain
MATRLIIDGYNLLFSSNLVEGSGDLEDLREELLGLLTRYRAARGHHMTVVFDGARGGAQVSKRKRTGPLRVVFSRRGETADEAILRRLSDAGDGTVVVTSDRELERSALKAGAEVVGVEEFAAKVLEALEPGAMEEDGEETCEEPTLSTHKRGNPRRASRRARRRSAVLRKL